MADISKIQIESGIYDIKDLIARENLETRSINVLLNGVTGDGVTDDTTAIQGLIDNNPLTTLYFPKGDYKISTPLSIPQANDKFVNLILDTNARIFTTDNINELIQIGFDKTYGQYDRYNNATNITIVGGIFDATNTQRAINLCSSCQLTRIFYSKIINVRNYGIYLTKDIVSGSTSGDAKICYCYIDGLGSNTDEISTGIYVESYDNEFIGIRIDRCKVGVNCNSSANDFIDVHATMLLHRLSGDTYTDAQYNATTGFISRGYNRFLNCYADSFGKGFFIKQTDLYGATLIDNCYTYHWGGTSGTETYAVYFDNCKPMASISNCMFKCPSVGTNHIIYCSNTSYIGNINKEDYLNLINNYVDSTNTTIPNVDLIYNLQLNKQNGLSMYGKNVSLSANTYYPLCILKQSTSRYNLNISNDVQLDIDINVKYINNSNCEIKVITKREISKTYRLALLNEFTVDGNTYCTLAIQTRSGESITNALNISNINKNGNNSTYGHIDMNDSATPITSPTAIATLPIS